MPPSPQRPNLLYIHSDQHNPYVMGCAGDRVVETPNLDRLAAEGVRCTQVYCPLGVRKRAAEVVDPFSLSVGFMLPHSPYLARRHLYDFYRERIGPPAVRQPFGEHLHPAMRWWRSHVDLHDVPEEWVLNGRAAYWALVAAMDAMIGRILNALRENGLADNTLVVYSSDHGDLVGEHDLWMKRTFYEESVKVPAILSWPGVLPCGSECHRVMSALDLNAAMLQALGAPALPNSPGRPALELLRTGAGAWEDLAFSEYALREGQVHRMVRRGRWKLIYHWKERPQLFNLDEDPREREDRAADPECREMVDELTALVLEGWDPARVAARLQARQADVDLIRRWAEKTGAPDKFRWEQRPGMTFREPRSG